MGGMGNQMFQYALGRNLSLKHNVPLKFDLSFLKNRNMGSFVYRDYDLDLFNVVSDFNINTESQIFVASEPHFHYSFDLVKSIDRLLNNNVSILLDGYWQSPLYFSDFENQIKQDFIFIDKIEDSSEYIKEMLNKINYTNSILVNIRRTDYLNTSFHGVMKMDYINNAKSVIESKVENPHYFIFSDDIDWCKENIKFENMTIVDHSYKGDRFGYYLQLMLNCKHFIIPNSTFAWWAAWLNNSPDKIVITPKQWFTDNNINTNDIIPSDWIRI